ncbi:BLUF domain-containing protein [Piscinibacter koreensis]|uniref:BLUF domain-containing protein n=1 Tax=Piscinibacter koreensis TaxID=2742824 RepID=A0A7Y6NJG2_9BURK|nr:BLUF domain-containing protein [Schlegelella koreensis]NUZ04224.1 BLUF domain-containing protein [Schlegelella koreensis]
MPSLRQLFYVSRPTPLCGAATIQDILQISRRNNRQRDITGCLLYSGDHFAQVLEGRSDVVEPLLDRIAVDPRHHEVRVLRSMPCSARRYGDWSMGYVHDGGLAEALHALSSGPADPADAARIDALLDRMRTDPVMGGY